MKNLKISDWPIRPLSMKVKTYNMRPVAEGIEVSEDRLIQKFRDARVGAQHATDWAADAFGYAQEIEKTSQEHDLLDLRDEDNPRRLVVRCFTDGSVTFQRSKFLGYKRKTRPIDLERSIRRLHGYILVDLRQFPTVRFMEVPAEAIAAAVHDGIIGINGLSAKLVDRFLRANFRIESEELPVMPFGGNAPRIRFKAKPAALVEERQPRRQLDLDL